MKQDKTHIHLFEDEQWDAFLPLVFTRPVGELRMGIFTMSERWAQWMNAEISHRTRPYLQTLFHAVSENQGWCINARLLPDAQLVAAIQQLKVGESLIKNHVQLAFRYDVSRGISADDMPAIQSEYPRDCLLISHITDLFRFNDAVLRNDFYRITQNQSPRLPDAASRIIGPEDQLFIEKDAATSSAIFNTTTGPIYIESGAEVMEGALIRGPFFLGKGAQVKMGTKIYGATTIGPYSKVGGELSNVVILGYSNKAHDGFIGNSILGEWCNLGADTNASNLKNNYSPVRIWSYRDNQDKDTGLTFCGLIMSDHAKCGINTMFNTGTVIGPCANIFDGGFPPKHFPAFGWGGTKAIEVYDLQKAIDTATHVMARRQVSLTPAYREMLTEVFKMTENHRKAATLRQK